MKGTGGKGEKGREERREERQGGREESGAQLKERERRWRGGRGRMDRR